MSTGREAAAAVRELVADLLPVLAPHAMLDADTGRLVLPVGTAHADISLDSITCVCTGLPPHTWPGRVEAWLTAKAAQVTAALEERRRLGQVEELLRVQVTPRLPEPERQRLMCTPYGDLLDIVVVLDHPDGGRLSRERADRLAVTDPGSHALRNTLLAELPSFTVTDRPLSEGNTVRVVSKEGNEFVTSALLDLDRFLPRPCRHGVLVGLPRYSEVLLHPVAPQRVGDVAPILAEEVRHAYEGADDRCDGRLFWWAEQQLYAVRFGRLTGRLRVPRPLRKLVR